MTHNPDHGYVHSIIGSIRECGVREGTLGVTARVRRRKKMAFGVLICLFSMFACPSGVLLAQEESPAFTIPSSNLVFAGSIYIAGAEESADAASKGAEYCLRKVRRALRTADSKPVGDSIEDPLAEGRLQGGSEQIGTCIKFEAREGSLMLLDQTPADDLGRAGLALTLDRTGKPGGQRGKAIVVHRYSIAPDPRGGEAMTRLEVFGTSYEKSVEVFSGDRRIFVGVVRDRFVDFPDSALVTELWNAIEEDENALDGMYEALYSFYGPTASACVVCDGVLVCATSIVGCENGWN